MKYTKDTDTIFIFMKLLILIILSGPYITLIIIIYKLSRFDLTKQDGKIDEFKRVSNVYWYGFRANK